MSQQRRKSRGRAGHRHGQDGRHAAPRLGIPETGSVESIGERGHGAVRPRGTDGATDTDGPLIFVPGTLPGETIRFRRVHEPKRAPGGELLELLTASPTRQTPPCPHFGQCGGCTLQHAGQPAIAGFKRQRIEQALTRRGLDTASLREPINGWGDGRRRMDFAARGLSDRVVLGLHRPGSKLLVDLADCPVADPAIRHSLPSLRDFAGRVLRAGEAADLHVTACDNGLDIVLTRERAPDIDERMDWPALVAKPGWLRLSWRAGHRDPAEPVVELTQPVIDIDGLAAPISAGGFLQATAMGQATLIRLVTAMAAAHTSGDIADLFCGIGTFTLPLARAHAERRLLAVDGSDEALRTLQKLRADHIGSRLAIEHHDLFRRPVEASRLKAFDTVIFDPPRAGAELQVQEIAAAGVATVIAVSCDPVSFARDAAMLVENGYRLETVQPVDQFQWSMETELVALLRKI